MQFSEIAGLFQFALPLVFSTQTIKEPLLYFTVCLTQGIAALLPTLNCPHHIFWPKDFVVWFVSSKEFISLFYSPWPTDIVWNCLDSLTVLSWQKCCHTDQFHGVSSSQWILRDFLRHWFTWAVMLMWRTPVTDEFFLCSCCVLFTSHTFGLVLFRFLLSPNSIIDCSFAQWKTRKISSNRFFKKISGYTNVKVSEKHLYVLW